ncbi:hypothetical protein T08_666 [Trichinella sp. T8]|nr:hypothetical protein T08_666 [Trichinella sp. T8]
MNSQLILNYRGRAWYLFESLAESTISIFLLISQEMHIHEGSGYGFRNFDFKLSRISGINGLKI